MTTSLPIIAVRWIEWILEKQPQILRLWLRMTLLWVEDDGAGQLPVNEPVCSEHPKKQELKAES